MSGLVGLITNLPKERAEGHLNTMMKTLHHEPFYTSGTWTEPSLGIYVGWNVHTASFSDGMPLSNESGDVVLVFAGEDLPDPGTRARLRSGGHLLGAAEASYLVHQCEEDANFPASVNGYFHALLADRRNGTVALMNDRYGMQRLYYYQSKDAFYFAAEAKAILAVQPQLRSLDLQSLGELIALDAVLENRSLFQDISVLPGASHWRFCNGVLERKGSYFSSEEWESQPELAPEAYYEELRDIFARNLPRYFAGQRQVGMSLTGGLDTRGVMAWYKGPAGSLPCYTFGGTYRECRDVVVARQVARTCNQPHQVIEAGTDFLSRFPELAERTVYLSDGCASVSCSTPLYVCQKAREIAPVRMTGNYGDQILRRYRAFKPRMPSGNIFRPEMWNHISKARETYQRIATTHPLSFSAFRQTAWHHHSLYSLEQSQVTQRSPFLDNDVVRINFRAPGCSIENDHLRLRLIEDGNSLLRQLRTDMGAGGRHELFSGALSRQYQRFTFKAEYAYDHGMPHWMARVDHALSPFHLERVFLGRHKYYHFRIWYRDALSKYVKEMLLDPRTLSRPYLDATAVKAMVRGHLKGDTNFTAEINALLSLELLQRLLVEH